MADAPAMPPPHGGPMQSAESTRQDCPTCGLPSPSAAVDDRVRFAPVYAVGSISAQFPNIGVEKEFAQVAGKAAGSDVVESAMLHRVLAEPDNVYLGRHMCWIFTAQHRDVFCLLPRDDTDVQRLVGIVHDGQTSDLLHLVVGRTTTAPYQSPCVSTGLPAVAADQVLGFTVDEFIASLPEPDLSSDPGAGPDDRGGHDTETDRHQFRAAARDLLLRLTQRADNYGLSDEHRAMNYLAIRYPALYHAVAQAHRTGKTLVGIRARHSHRGDRRQVAVTLTVRDRRTDIADHYRCVVDVTDVFPFLVSRLERTYE